MDIEGDRVAAEFWYGKEVWKGCIDLDCVVGCRMEIGDYRCERFERAFEAWLLENRPELAKTIPGGAK